MQIRTLLQLFRCLLCGRHYQGDKRVCSYCTPHLPWLNQYCKQCGLPNYPNQTCQYCFLNPNSLLATECHFVFKYDEPVKTWIKLWKYHQQMQYQALFLDCLLEKFTNTLMIEPEQIGILGVPISNKRYKERGFNQTDALSKKLASYLKLPLFNKYFTSSEQSDHHAQMSATSRQSSQNPFKLSPNTPQLPKQMIILDDVMTTGHTLNQLASILKKAGVLQIFYWGIARTIL